MEVFCVLISTHKINATYKAQVKFVKISWTMQNCYGLKYSPQIKLWTLFSYF